MVCVVNRKEGQRNNWKHAKKLDTQNSGSPGIIGKDKKLAYDFSRTRVQVMTRRVKGLSIL